MSLKIMQINIWAGRIQRPLYALIEREQPDIVFVQEALNFPGAIDTASLWGTWNTLDGMAEHGNLTHSFYAPCNSWTMFGETLSFGNAILSKVPLTNETVHYTAGNGPIHHEQPGNIDYNTSRNFQHTVVHTGQTQLHLINHHGHWVPNNLGNEVSVERLQVVADYIRGLQGPVIMAGDLNLSPDTAAVQGLLSTTGLIDTTSHTGTTTLSAAHYVDRNIICDYIFASPEINVTEAKILDDVVSDHRPLIAKIDL